VILTVLASMILVALAVSSRSLRPARRRFEDGPELAAHLAATWRREVAATRARLEAVARHLVTTRTPLTSVFVEDAAAHLVFGDGTVVLLREPSPSGVRLLVDEVAADRPVRLGALHLTRRPTAGIARLERVGGSVPIGFDGAAVLAERHPAHHPCADPAWRARRGSE
jgi:hypothetical protein